jgi:hypothetical protein
LKLTQLNPPPAIDRVSESLTEDFTEDHFRFVAIRFRMEILCPLLLAQHSIYPPYTKYAVRFKYMASIWIPCDRPLPVEFEVKINKVHGSLRMTVPKEVAKALSVKQGDIVLVSVTNSSMLVRRKPR